MNRSLSGPPVGRSTGLADMLDVIRHMEQEEKSLFPAMRTGDRPPSYDADHHGQAEQIPKPEALANEFKRPDDALRRHAQATPAAGR